jgi:hypothetical protein
MEVQIKTAQYNEFPPSLLEKIKKLTPEDRQVGSTIEYRLTDDQYASVFKQTGFNGARGIEWDVQHTQKAAVGTLMIKNSFSLTHDMKRLNFGIIERYEENGDPVFRNHTFINGRFTINLWEDGSDLLYYFMQLHPENSESPFRGSIPKFRQYKAAEVKKISVDFETERSKAIVKVSELIDSELIAVSTFLSISGSKEDIKATLIEMSSERKGLNNLSAALANKDAITFEFLFKKAFNAREVVIENGVCQWKDKSPILNGVPKDLTQQQECDYCVTALKPDAKKVATFLKQYKDNKVDERLLEQTKI